MAPVCPRASSARVSSRVCQPSRAARTTRCRLLLLADEGREAAGGEFRQVIGRLLERRCPGALLELVHRVETELGLAVFGRRRSVEVRFEPGEVEPGEPDL